ncbi:MAG: protein NO VEIN domain-containing protein [Planktothrix sp.]
MGQKPEPKVDDYLDFLQELLDEYKTDPLTEEDKHSVLQVLKKLEYQLLSDEQSVQNIDIPFLTEAGTLRPAKEILIPDAPWWHDDIDRNILLDPRVSVTLAKSTGSRSLLRDVTEEPTESQPDQDPTVKIWCHNWEITLNSPEFHYGLERLVYHEYDLDRQVKITPYIKVLPGKEIKINLFLDRDKIASGLTGYYYFDTQEMIFYISSKSQGTMAVYLAEAINNSMIVGDCHLSNLLPLARILDTEPSKIQTLLNELRIRSLPGEVDESSETNSIDQAKPDSPTTEEEAKQAPEQDIKASTRTNTGKGENPVHWGEFGEKWARLFYKYCGYNSSIEKQPDLAGFDFLCKGDGKPTIKAEVKAITSTSPNLRITINEWSKMVEIGESYELLIVSHQGESVPEIIRIQHLWTTLTNDFFAKLRQKNLTTWAGEEAEVLLGFNLNSDKSQNHVVLCWHRLCEGNHSDNIKRYCPNPSTVNSENQEVKFKLIP